MEIIVSFSEFPNFRYINILFYVYFLISLIHSISLNDCSILFASRIVVETKQSLNNLRTCLNSHWLLLFSIFLLLTLFSRLWLFSCSSLVCFYAEVVTKSHIYLRFLHSYFEKDMKNIFIKLFFLQIWLICRR